MMRIIIILTVLLFPVTVSPPSTLNTVESGSLTRSDNLEQPSNEGSMFNIEVPAFIKSILHNIKNFFVGPTGVITRFRNFVNGKIMFSTHFFGQKIDLQANIPSSLEEADKALRSFTDKLHTDPMTRTLFAMYLNVVVVIVVFLSMIAKHIQISLHSLRSRVNVNNDDMSINWSAMANPSLISSANPGTFLNSSETPLLLNDLRGILSPDQDDNSDRVKQLSYIHPCSEARPCQPPIQSAQKQSEPSLTGNSKFSNKRE
ncbi:hypothetical protein KIN20_024232 [Parelaphostrongylus tenuis]|uniref:Uncharacterized protein n=1 Tax=Parelaphostrongylus tenuis TaxID=148309 RepID=A0AAD5N9V4_PARTN|nr:hypothetical protein KIN20_024232 [Parelaphostrongylus tenuis]